ncbi:hypothetical protein DYGSA30_32590 [Dyella sp. GSA-30]|nr:hypothetical protein DYGSA30_32590 [Dyella sp. GSA-30]
MALGVIQHRQTADGTARVCHNRLQQSGEVTGHTLDRMRLEQLGAVLETAEQALLALGQGQRQVELGRGALALQHGHRQARHGHLAHGHVLQHQHHLEQRRVTGVPLRLQDLDQLLERYILVGISIQGVLSHLLQQAVEIEREIDLGTQHQRIDEEADQVLDVGTVAIGDRRADADVALPRIAGQQHIERSAQRHE